MASSKTHCDSSKWPILTQKVPNDPPWKKPLHTYDSRWQFSSCILSIAHRVVTSKAASSLFAKRCAKQEDKIIGPRELFTPRFFGLEFWAQHFFKPLKTRLSSVFICSDFLDLLENSTKVFNSLDMRWVQLMRKLKRLNNFKSLLTFDGYIFYIEHTYFQNDFFSFSLSVRNNV